MRSHMLVLLVSALLMIAATLPAQTKKYDVKSGIITFELVMSAGKMKISQKVVLFFDEYGMKECKDTYSGGVLEQSNMSDGKTRYVIIHAKKTAYKRGDAYRGTEMRFDWDEVSAKDKSEGKAKKLANMTIAGKDCEAFETVTSGTRSTFAGWAHTTLFMDVVGNGIQSTTRALKIEENAKIPPEKFGVPAGFQVNQSGL